MNLKGILPIVILGGLAWALSKMIPAGSQAQPASPLNELPGYTFPAPGTQGVVTNAIGEVVAENYVVGSAQQAYENAQEIRAEAAAVQQQKYPVGIIRSYADVMRFDTKQFDPGYGGLHPDFFDPATGRYLDISPYGWVVFGPSDAYLGKSPTGFYNLYGSTSFGGLSKELPQWLNL